MGSAGITLSSVLLADIARESFLLETIHFCGDRPVEKPSAVAVIILGKMLSLVTGGTIYSFAGEIFLIQSWKSWVGKGKKLDR